MSILRKTKRDYYGNINGKDIVDTKQFWKAIKSCFLIGNSPQKKSNPILEANFKYNKHISTIAINSPTNGSAFQF